MPRQVILEVAGEFNRQFDRNYGLFEAYRLDDAEVAIVVANSTAGTAKVVVDQLRDGGRQGRAAQAARLPSFPGARRWPRRWVT